VTRVVGLGGGVGASRLWTALVPALAPGRLTLVVNTADDLWIHGLRVCPDIDTTLYALSGRQDLERGWGVKGETWRAMDALRALGHDVWFNLGDTDLATHLLRTGMLRRGAPLSAVTARLAEAMGVTVRVLPMSDDDVTTRVEIVGGAVLHYEEFLVRHGAVPAVCRVLHDGIERAAPAPGVLDAIAAADVVVIAPSNPIASVQPIVDLPGMRAALAASAAMVVAVSPSVSGVPITAPGEARRATSRARLLEPLGVPPTASGIARLYQGLVHRYLIDAADADERDAVAALGIEPMVVRTLVHLGAPAVELVDAVLAVTR
jgi:LPPG:FO 2-phospho-L-lactate transferase